MKPWEMCLRTARSGIEEKENWISFRIKADSHFGVNFEDVIFDV